MKRAAVLLFAILATAGCQKNSYSTFSRKYHVLFSCDTNVSPYNILSTPGQFLSVTQSLKTGNLIITDSNGKKYNQTLSESQTRQYSLGLGGLILGRPLFGDDQQSLWAFDLGCPECDQVDVTLTFDIHGTATCSKCNAQWSLNSGGFPVSGSGKTLYRYPTLFSNGMLTVSN